MHNVVLLALAAVLAFSCRNQEVILKVPSPTEAKKHSLAPLDSRDALGQRLEVVADSLGKRSFHFFFKNNSTLTVSKESRPMATSGLEPAGDLPEGVELSAGPKSHPRHGAEIVSCLENEIPARAVCSLTMTVDFSGDDNPERAATNLRKEALLRHPASGEPRIVSATVAMMEPRQNSVLLALLRRSRTPESQGGFLAAVSAKTGGYFALAPCVATEDGLNDLPRGVFQDDNYPVHSRGKIYFKGKGCSFDASRPEGDRIVQGDMKTWVWDLSLAAGPGNPAVHEGEVPKKKRPQTGNLVFYHCEQSGELCRLDTLSPSHQAGDIDDLGANPRKVSGFKNALFQPKGSRLYLLADFSCPQGGLGAWPGSFEQRGDLLHLSTPDDNRMSCQGGDIALDLFGATRPASIHPGYLEEGEVFVPEDEDEQEEGPGGDNGEDPGEVNQAPVAQDGQIQAEEDREVLVELSYFDPEGDLAQLCSVHDLQNVIVSDSCSCDSAGICSLTAKGVPDFHGQASFGFTVTAAGQESNSATHTLEIASVDDAPVAFDATAETKEDEAVSIELVYGDADGDLADSCRAFDFQNAFETQVCRCEAGYCQVETTPLPDFHGQASFGFTVTAAGAESSEASVTVNVEQVDEAPVVHSKSFNANEDEVFAIAVDYQDADGDVATSCSVSGLINLNLVSACSCDSAGVCSATAKGRPNFNGQAYAAVSVEAGGMDSNSAQYEVIIDPVDDAPVALSGSAEAFRGRESAFELPYSDTEGDQADYCSVSTTQELSVTTSCSCASGVCSVGITPNSGASGDVDFSFSVASGGLESNAAIFTVSVSEDPGQDPGDGEGDSGDGEDCENDDGEDGFYVMCYRHKNHRHCYDLRRMKWVKVKDGHKNK